MCAPGARAPFGGRLALTFLLAILAAAIGVAAIVYGEADDAPGLQLLGVLFVAGAVGLGVRTARRGR